MRERACCTIRERACWCCWCGGRWCSLDVEHDHRAVGFDVVPTPRKRARAKVGRVDQHVAIGMATEAVQPPGSRTHPSRSPPGLELPAGSLR